MAKLTRKEKVARELLIIENSLLYWKTVIILNIFRPLSVEKKLRPGAADTLVS